MNLNCFFFLLVVFVVCILPGESISGRASRSSRSSYTRYSSRSYYSSYRSTYTPSSPVRYYTYSTYRSYSTVYGYVRYYRPYYGTAYLYYYYFYYYYSPGYYLSSPSDAPGYTVCENLVANQNSTNLGYFICPMDFEPSDYTACCGDSEAQYCCRPTRNVNVAGIVIGVIIGLLVVITAASLIIWRCYCYTGRVGANKVVVHKQETIIATTTDRPTVLPGPGYGDYSQPAVNPPINQPYPYPSTAPTQNDMYGKQAFNYNS